MDEEESILKEFLVECSEGIDRLDQEFVAIEKDPTNTTLLASIFRTIHTIKGTCGFLGLPNLENVAHGTENILSRMRDGEMPVTPEGVTVLLEAVDVIKAILVHIETHGKEPDEDYGPVRQKLDAFLDAGPSDAEKKKADSVSASTKKKQGGRSKTKSAPAKTADEVPAAAIPVAPSKESAPPENKPKPKPISVTESTVRVDVGLLDKLINLVGELVLARNQLLQRLRGKNDAIDTGAIQQLNLITTELQDTVMKTRMQPIRNVWDRLPRVVRDLARANGKEVELVMEGAETELDRSLLEAIKDPLTHIVRNAVDHGIEPPDVRTAKGKPAGGTLFLKAYHEGGQINIEISDDGNGIDVEKVKLKAVEKGVISPETISRMSEREGLNLIFRAGLSTAQKVTNVSGRGVGMDVVKTNIEKIGGMVELSSTLGKGTSLRIKIPLTLAIIPASIVISGDEPFAIPQTSLLELVRVDGEKGGRIEVIQGADFFRLRGQLLPLVSLSRILRLEGGEDPSGPESEGRSETNIVVLKSGECSFGLIVDEVKDSEEIVVKPLSRQLKGIPVLAGATIMGDGKVALILDVLGIAQEGGLLRTDMEETQAAVGEEASVASDVERQAVILFSISKHDQFAVPLSRVHRLEEFDAKRFEQAAGREVIQYRGGLLPLFRFGSVIGIDASSPGGEVSPVIVFSRNEKSVGLVVGRICDIVEAEMDLHAPPDGKTGVLGSLVIDGQTTDLLDADQVIETLEPGWMAERVMT